MTGGQDDAAEAIDTGGAKYPKASIEWEEFGKLRLCRELLEAAVEAWEISRVYTITGRRPYLSEEWHAKAKGAIGD